MISIRANPPIGEAECLPPKPWNEVQFMQYRPHLVSFLQQEVTPIIDRDEECSILIRAPVKSGKREMVEYLATRAWSRINQFASRACLHIIMVQTRRRLPTVRNHETRYNGILAHKKGIVCGMI